jgi:hypothetical protein
MDNIEERGFLVGITGRSNRVLSRRMWEQKEVTASLQDGLRELTTLLTCVCTGALAFPPSLISNAANALTHTFAPWYLLAEEEYQCCAEYPWPAQCHAFIDTFFHHGLPSTSFFITLGMLQSSCVFMFSFLVPTEESEHSKIERPEDRFLHYLYVRFPSHPHPHPHPKHDTAETIQANTLPIGLDSRTFVRVAIFAVRKRMRSG